MNSSLFSVIKCQLDLSEKDNSLVWVLYLNFKSWTVSNVGIYVLMYIVDLKYDVLTKDYQLWVGWL